METVGRLIAQKANGNVQNIFNAEQNLPALPSNISPAALMTLKIYGDERKFMATFNPDMQTSYCRPKNITRCIRGTAPSLGVVAQAYGARTVETWMMVQLENLAEFSGVRQKMQREQLIETARVIISQYGFLKVTEIMLFLMQCKSGVYGHFYGSVDPQRITSSLYDFLDWRLAQIARIEHEEEKAAREREQREHKGVTYEQYLKLKNNETEPSDETS